MRRLLLAISCTLLSAALFVGPSHAQRSEPLQANKFQATLVTAYKPCAAPNDMNTGSLSLPACHPAVRDDDVCRIASDGGGKFKAKPDPAGDIAYKVQLKGIQGCDGDTLVAVATIRITTNDCGSADPNGCTIVDLTDFPISGPGSCVISRGACKIGSTVNTELGAGTVQAGKLAAFQVNGAGLKRTTSVNGGTPGKVAAAGILVP
jgi:hypothetical protein